MKRCHENSCQNKMHYKFNVDILMGREVYDLTINYYYRSR